MVGGFLGFGKTTLILKAAELLRQRGKRVAVILNDQDAGLVDTQLAHAHGVMAREVADGCFCCRFSEFITVAKQLVAYWPDVIFAEPVGSCIDLSATVIRPLQTIYEDQFRLAPLTVLLDSSATNRLQNDSPDHDIHYLVTHQLDEADLVCATKQDLSGGPPRMSVPIDFQLSGKTGCGVEPWLNEVLHTTRVVGARLLQVDYERYAQAEAALGWINLHATVRLETPLSPALLCGPLLDRLESSLTRARIPIAHLKVFDRTATGWVKASVCANGTEPVVDGDLLADPAVEHQLALNLRAIADPEALKKILWTALDGLAGSVEVSHLRAFRPAAPKPEYRYEDELPLPRIGN